MLAISANANISNKSALSTNGSSYGYINENFIDRYVPNRQEITGSGAKVSDTIKSSAVQFNKAISDFYSTINPSETNVSHATNYYIEKMSKIKNDEYPTRASQMIPVSVNFTTDGIAGMAMGQAFTVPDELLPYTYVTKKITNGPADHINNIGFVMTGLTHTIDNNSWNTSVNAGMIYLKDKTEFNSNVIGILNRTGVFGESKPGKISGGGPSTVGKGPIPCGDLADDAVNEVGDAILPAKVRAGWVGKCRRPTYIPLDAAYKKEVAKKLLALLGDRNLAICAMGSIMNEQRRGAFDYNFGGVDITHGVWSYSTLAQYVVGYFVINQGAGDQAKTAFASFKDMDSFLLFQKNRYVTRFTGVADADTFAIVYAEKWGGNKNPTPSQIAHHKDSYNKAVEAFVAAGI
jgi:hypothetical protein